MHLHGHLADYGPVYAFWCFAFERLNGILGSYHLNNHHISAQFMQQFLDSNIYAPINWPGEYIHDYFPLSNQFSYQKGSLQQATIETEIATGSDLTFSPLPQVREYVTGSA